MRVLVPPYPFQHLLGKDMSFIILIGVGRFIVFIRKNKHLHEYKKKMFTYNFNEVKGRWGEGKIYEKKVPK